MSIIGVMEILRDLAVIYAYSFATGIGLYQLVAPRFLRRPTLAVLLIPGVGLLQLTIVSAYLIYFSAPVVNSLYVSAAIGAITLIASAFRSRAILRDLGSIVSNALPSSAGSYLRLGAKVAGFAVLLAVVLAPVLRAGMPTTPYRIGVDQIGYAETAQYLLEGGSLQKVRGTLLGELNESDITQAKTDNLKALRFETYVDSEFLLKATRWGFPGTVAALTFLAHSGHVYRIEFVLLILSYALVLVIALVILRDYFLMPDGVAFAVVAALALNYNLLNVYYEGQLTEIFMMPYFTVALALFLRARSLQREKGESGWSWLPLAKSLPLFALLVACMFAAYNEILVLLIGFVVVTGVLDALFYRRLAIAPLIYATLGVLAGFVAALPFSHQWVAYTFANLRGLPKAGFWQPHWASIAEIVGFLDMYHVPGYVLRARSTLNEAISLTISVALVVVFLYFLRRVRDIDASFWSAPLLIILAAYLKTRFVDQIPNYPYMKIYTMLVPLVVCVMFAALYCLAKDKKAFGVVFYLAIVSVAITGVLYIGQYVAQDGYVTTDMFSMYRYSDGERRFSRFALFGPRPIPSIADLMLTPLITMNLVNEDNKQKYIAPYLEAPVALMFRSADLVCRDCVVDRFRKNIVYMNDSYIVLDTGMRLKDVCKGQTLGPGLPMPPCDYAVAPKYLSYSSRGRTHANGSHWAAATACSGR